MKQLLFSLLFVLGLTLLPLSASAARLYLEPAGGEMIVGCPKSVQVRIDHLGDESNTTQFYYAHNLTGAGESAAISGGWLYDNYVIPGDIPPGLNALVAYSLIPVDGDNQVFARLTLQSDTIGKTVTVDVDFDEGADITSRIYNTGVNYLTEVAGGSYTVVDGFCDTIAPVVINRVPVPDDPNYPEEANIFFDVTDNDSGVDIATLEVTIAQEGESIVYAYDDARLSYTEFDTLDYAIVIDPIEDFIPESLITITVSVTDRAGNTRNTSWSFNGLSCADLGCGGDVITQCNDGIDNDADGAIDLADSGCPNPGDNNEYVPPGTNQCNDGIDNDGDGDIDAGDPGCRSEDNGGGTVTFTENTTTTVTNTVTVGGGGGGGNIPDCRDGRDNDGDGLVDYPADPDCDDENDQDEYKAVPGAMLTPDDLLYFLADRTIQTYATGARVVAGLEQNSFGVDLDISDVNSSLDSVVLHTEFGMFEMYFDNSTGRYRTDITLPSKTGFSDAYVRVVTADEETISIPFRLQIEPFGQVRAFTSSGTELVSGATVSLEAYRDGAFLLVERMAAESGRYAFVVPNGTYRLITTVDGYHRDTTARFEVANSIINRQITVRKQVNLLDPSVSVQEKVEYTIATAREQVEGVREIIDDPIVEERSKDTVAPLAAALTATALIPALSALGFINFLRYLFLQPLLLFGRKKREKWGYVYDTLTRNPIDLAQVRLLDNRTNRVVQSRVTDGNGRYIFFADPGVYRIEVEKNRYAFPSNLLFGEREDGPYLDIYHGEPIRVTEENTTIVANIPVDPVTAEKTPRRIVLEKFWKKVRGALSALGVIAGIVAVIISPTVWTITLLVLQIVVLVLFYQIAKPKKPKSWGIVYDAHDKKTLAQVVVRLFSKRFDKLVSTDYTDSNGRYAFLVNPNEYYVTYQKMGYDDARKDVYIDKSSDVISEDVGLKRQQV